ncbi:sigma-70 family RNA polymerase sigma factor [Actinoplanes sp. Pm04-4]|uniref:Sigma-70 family RNA polymerase sigma factor n=1 Tax=Paractinoplanes pyxinae TaxID=2997416 RepID=A0ABT4B8A5_9ACTN|nr:sigma-70 family RNA polymerase sigma factor [Actinoplanes pyxinae]MCY1142746.1 sigma-70 family RNA polymerase sigma factor [Actinoplanes pyxinae]
MTTVDGTVALNPDPPDDDGGAGRLKAQHDAEFQVFTEAGYGTVERILLARCRQRELVQDALHEAFLHARVKWPEVRVHVNPVGWVITTARFKILKEQRKLRDEAATAPEDLPPAPPLDVTDAWQARELVERWLPQLSPRQAEVFRMSRDGFGDREIAVHLGVAEDSVVSYRSAAIGKLRQLAEQAGYRSKTSRRPGGRHESR